MATAFLTSVKEELTGLFAEAFDEISSDLGDGVPEAVPTAMQKLQKKAWTLFEAKLKESFQNGRKAAGAPPKRAEGAEPEATSRTGNPFRKAEGR